jgi:hypothetical protein
MPVVDSTQPFICFVATNLFKVIIRQQLETDHSSLSISWRDKKSVDSDIYTSAIHLHGRMVLGVINIFTFRCKTFGELVVGW